LSVARSGGEAADGGSSVAGELAVTEPRGAAARSSRTLALREQAPRDVMPSAARLKGRPKSLPTGTSVRSPASIAAVGVAETADGAAAETADRARREKRESIALVSEGTGGGRRGA
jgi:hypothetical protein